LQDDTLLVVAGLIEDGEGRLLLAQRRPDQSFPGCWELPGGKPLPGEDPRDALRRELAEELGLAAEVGAIAEVVFHRYPSFHLLMLVYRCRPGATAPRPLEVSDWAWFAPHELAGLPAPPADLDLFAALAAGDLR